MDNGVLFKTFGIYKSFGPTQALINVDFELRRGNVCGLIGENGSGKSTLSSIIAGILKPDKGRMYFKEKEYSPQSMLDARKSGIGIIVQEAGTLSHLTVAENIFVGDLKRFEKLGFVNEKQMYKEAEAILHKIGVDDIDPAASVDSLNFEDRKIVEIARAMYTNPEILIVDESTTALAQKGRKIIYNLIKSLQNENKAVIFISHDLDEVMYICNTVTVLRDGVKIQTLSRDEMSVDKMKKLMVGRELTNNYYRADYDGTFGEKVVLKANRITSEDGLIMNLNLELHEGEILGIGGLANCGMHELGKILFGASRPVTGEVIHTPSNTVLKKPHVAIRKGIGYLSKDRDHESIIINASIQENIALPLLDRLKKLGLLSGKKEKEIVSQQIGALSIKCISGKQFCTQLSGGNKQKVAFAKWLARQCDIFIIDCPTRGIDIGVKAAIYSMIYELKKEGKSIIMISEELPELIGMSDRILIMKNGAIAAEIPRSKNVNDSMLIEYMI
ncbi:MAG TPA: sugar ABC transporter ATP-binding protein [Clostridiaceae bacterium]|nr:sugar ABC transporter ATP-binding protein [Clostridiaceae bacterium]